MEARENKLIELVAELDDDGALALANEMLDGGISPTRLVELCREAMDIVGKRFEEGEYFLPELILGAKTMVAVIDLVKPLLAAGDMPTLGTVVLATVVGDLHDIGKNLVGLMLETAGFTVIDLGVDVPPQKFVRAAIDNNAKVIAMSALLTTTMPIMKDTIELLQKEGLKDKVRVMIGGSPITQDFADRIGADGYAPDASSAVDVCRRLVA
jgi:5-methyltetrahydrofolate--homocysteine methyltransferase